MRRAPLIAVAGLLALVVAGGVGYRVVRGPVGGGDALGELAATPVPEFGSLEAARWQNGAPISLAKSRGEVVFVEGWSPG